MCHCILLSQCVFWGNFTCLSSKIVQTSMNKFVYSERVWSTQHTLFCYTNKTTVINWFRFGLIAESVFTLNETLNRMEKKERDNISIEKWELPQWTTYHISRNMNYIIMNNKRLPNVQILPFIFPFIHLKWPIMTSTIFRFISFEIVDVGLFHVLSVLGSLSAYEHIYWHPKMSNFAKMPKKSIPRKNVISIRNQPALPILVPYICMYLVWM